MRSREDGKWETRTHSSMEAFLRRPVAGDHQRINIGDSNHSLDLLTVNRNSDLTAVFFHGAVPLSTETYPVFNGIGISKLANANLIAVSDPSLQLAEISLGWHLGNKFTGPVADIIADAVSHTCKYFNSNRTVFTGSSAGGYAAWNCARKFKNSVTLIANPHLALNRPPYLKMPQLAKEGFEKEVSNQPKYEDLSFLNGYGPVDTIEHLPIEPGQKVLIYQNIGDGKFLNGQLSKFITRTIDQNGILYRFEFDGPGHLPINRQTYLDSLQALASPDPVDACARQMGFKPAEEALVEIL